MWNEGYPKEKGLYKCLVGEKEMILIHHHCDLTGRSYWSTLGGQDIVGYDIKWNDEKPTQKELMG